MRELLIALTLRGDFTTFSRFLDESEPNTLDHELMQQLLEALVQVRCIESMAARIEFENDSAIGQQEYPLSTRVDDAWGDTMNRVQVLMRHGAVRSATVAQAARRAYNTRLTQLLTPINTDDAKKSAACALDNLK